jgi:5-methylcytosine-specific restriction endonuclease McrA
MTSPSIANPDSTNNLKRCSRCHECKPREAFSRDKTKRDGLLNQCKACHAISRVANPERVAKQRRAYSASNHRRRARKLATGGTFTTADLDAIRAAQTDKRGRLICWRCGKPIKGTPELDHWIPIARGGRNDAGNLHYMHATCNRNKGAKLPTEIGRLI